MHHTFKSACDCQSPAGPLPRGHRSELRTASHRLAGRRKEDEADVVKTFFVFSLKSAILTPNPDQGG
jgi:hypothetical protein